MSAPLGNKFGRGKKGRSGRKGAGEEFNRFQRLWNLWTDKNLPEELKKKMKDKKPLSAEEMHLVRGYMKSDLNLNAIFKKLYPDNLDVTSAGNKIVGIEVIRNGQDT